ATLLVPSGPLAGEVMIDGKGKIACASASCSGTSGYTAATHIACTNAVISPGFVNAHDHTAYDLDPPVDHGDIRYQHRNEWRTGADGAMALPSQRAVYDTLSMGAVELRFLVSGVTSIVGVGGTPGLARDLADAQSELEGLSGNIVNFDTFPLGDQNGTILTSGCAYPKVDTTASAFMDGWFAPHFGEGINPGAENEIVCADSTALGLVTSKTAIIHAVGTNAKDVAQIAAAGASVVWSPRSNISLYGNTAPVTELKYAGVNIALGTDWLPSGSMNELRELACASEMNAHYFAKTFSDQELVEMATANAAKSVGFGTQIGTIAPGMVADLVVFAATANKDFSAVVQASNEDVALVLRGGTPLYGDTLLMQAAGGTGSKCATLDVCNVQKTACIDIQNVKLSDLQGAIAKSYPLFSCRGQTPPNEPSCTPYRDTYPNGTSATDGDGDGVPDGSDDCRAIFNPPRSMDGDKQSDVDGDGFGDACDAKPLDPGAH
ncbi:MAG TPA: amidohydrolase family protein, partial [Polyangiaceae bacterium]